MKKQSLLLFKNAFKQAFRNKIQLVGLVVLVLLSSTIFSLMQTSLARISDEYSTLIEKSNLHDFVIDLSNTAEVSYSPPTTHNKEKVDAVINTIANSPDNEFKWDRVEGRTLQLANNGNERILKVLTYNSHARIDKLVINKGNAIGDNNVDKITPSWKQTVINKEFAQKNDLSIGDTIRVQPDQLGTSLKVTNYNLNDPTYSGYNWLKVVGYGTSADFTTPIIDQTTPIPNKTREGILYVDPIQFGLTALKNATDDNYQWSYDHTSEKVTISANSDREIYFVGKSRNDKKNNIKLISESLRNKYINTTDSDAALVYKLGDSNYAFNNRTNTLNATIIGFKSLLIALLLIVLGITGITVVLITYKNIDNSRTQIGILKSLGYANGKILITALAYPMVAALIGTILVFLPASGLQLIIVNTFANYFNLDFGSFIFDTLGFLYCLILTFGFLSIIAWIISALTVIKSPIELIKNESVTVNSRFSRMVKTSSSNRGFLTRFRLSLFTSSIGKMGAAALTMFLGTVLMTTAIIGPKIMSDNKIVSYTGMNYKSSVEYAMPTYNSPFTMYKTYNPTLKPWEYVTTTGTDKATYVHPDRATPNEFIKELLNNSINSEAYAPMSNASEPTEALTMDLGANGLTFLEGKMLTKNFLDGLDQSKVNDNVMSPFMISLAWPDAVQINNAVRLPDPTDPNKFYSAETFNILKQFYRNYRSTVAMSLNPKYASATSINKIDPKLLIDLWNTDMAGKKLSKPPISDNSFAIEANNFSFNTSDKKYPWHLINENQLLNKSYDELGSIVSKSWINKISIWYASLFFNRTGQIVVQGTYSRSPYFIRQNIANAYSNPDAQFNVSFNTIPYNKDTDELGTYFIGTPDLNFNGKKYPMKVYGLQNQQQLGKPSMMQLYNSDGSALNPLLETKNNDSSTSIVINQTIAKQLNLKINSEFKMNTNGNMLQFKNAAKNYENFEPSKIDLSKINSSEPKTDNNVTLMPHHTNFTQVSDLDDAYINLGIDATPMLKQVVAGNVVSSQDKNMTNYKVVGIYNGYGQPNAYISKNNADSLLKYDQTRSNLYQIFQQEWKDKIPTLGIDFSQLATLSYENFNKLPASNNLVKMFNNEEPIFNFKLSNSDSLPDITNSFSTSQIYGDFSAWGLNGGKDLAETPPIDYQGYGAGSAVNVSPLYIHHQLLNQITDLVDTVLGAFIIFSLIISFFIILLTSNLVIYENRKTIATMKTLGYSDAKITNIVIGMYLPVIAAMFVFGFPVGWLVVKLIINFLIHNTTWVLPLFFVWWLPFVVGAIVLGIYATTFVIDWYAMKKINPIKTLNEID